MGLGNEAVEGSKMGTLFIMFVAIVAVALAGFTIGKNLVNTGLDNMQTTVQQVTDSRFSDYNNKIVRGSKVKSAIETFANEEVAIFVNNITFNTSATKVGDVDATKTNVATIPTSDDGVADKGKVQGVDSTGKTYNARFVNYNAVLAKSDGKISTTNISVDSLYKDLNTGNYVFKDGFVVNANGDVSYYLKTTNLNKKGDAEYIADSASYSANLIKSSAGEIVGIVFVQRKLG